jgi:hypothetical protein
MIISHILTTSLIQSEKFSILCGGTSTVISPTFKLQTGELTSGPNGFTIKTTEIDELITMLGLAKDNLALAKKLEIDNKKFV